MQVKKSPEANLEKKKSLFLEIGLVLALAICLFAFEWTTEEVSTSTLGDLSQQDVMEEEINFTEELEQPQQEEQVQEEIEQEQIIEELVVVDDDVKVDDIKINTEADDRTRTTSQIVTSNFEVTEEEVLEPIAFAVVEEKPAFPGGDAAIMKFITENITYPAVAKELGIQGRVYVQFVVDQHGRVTQVQVARGVDPHLDAEAMRVVRMMPPWSPGKQRGKAVPVTNILPITFTLR